MELKLEDVIFEGLSRLSDEELDRRTIEDVKHPSATALERLAERRQWNLKELAHTNTCAWCRTTIRLIREELGIMPWWEESQEAARRALSALINLLPQVDFGNAGEASLADMVTGNKVYAGANAGRASVPPQYCVPSVVMHSERQIEHAEIAVMSIRFVPDRSLWLSVRIAKRFKSLGESPLEMTVVSYPEGRPLDTFLLPKLSAGRQENMELELPSELLPIWQEIEARPPSQLPLRFILRPYVHSIEGDDEM